MVAQRRRGQTTIEELTLATAERTWQSLAWETSARVAMAGGDCHRARTCLETRLEKRRAAGRHRLLARDTVHALANSLEDHERCRRCERSPMRGRSITTTTEQSNESWRHP